MKRQRNGTFIFILFSLATLYGGVKKIDFTVSKGLPDSDNQPTLDLDWKTDLQVLEFLIETSTDLNVWYELDSGEPDKFKNHDGSYSYNVQRNKDEERRFYRIGYR